MNASRLQIGQRYYGMFRGRFRVYEVTCKIFDESGACVGMTGSPIFSLDTYNESEAKKNVYQHNGWGGNTPCENRGEMVVMFYRYNTVAKRNERLIINTCKKNQEEAVGEALKNGYTAGKFIKFWTV